MKTFILILLNFIVLRLSAQVSLNLQLPGGGLVPMEQLWNVTVMNTSEAHLQVSMKISLRDAETNMEMLSGLSGEFILPKGMKTVFIQDVQPVLYNYTNPDFAKSFLPLGEYIVCYEITPAGTKELPATQECMQLNIDPLSPPLLNSPADQSEIQNPYPQFTWFPPTPFIMFSRLNYDIIVAEVLPGQAPSDAIQQNVPVYSRNNLSQHYDYLSASTPSLKLNKLYAWQVIARNASNYSGKTAVWTFSLEDNTAMAVGPADHHFILDDVSKGIHHVSGNEINIRYYSTAAEYRAEIKCFDDKGNLVKNFKSQIVPGNNYIDLHLSTVFDKGALYKICLVDHEKVGHYLSFTRQ